MAKYAAQSALALRLVSGKGKLATISRVGAIIDPVTQQTSTDVINYTANVVAFPLSASKARYLFGDGADITKDRLSFTMAMKDVEQTPRNGDCFVWSGKTYTLLSVELLDPAGDGAILAQGYAEVGGAFVTAPTPVFGEGGIFDFSSADNSHHVATLGL